jgi:transcription termination factor Rho
VADQADQVEVKLSDRTTAVLAPLSAIESLNADELVGASRSPAAANKVYAICSIRQLNGEPVNPQKNKAEFISVASRLDFGEMLKLGIEYGKITEATFSDELKNELAALSSDS